MNVPLKATCFYILKISILKITCFSENQINHMALCHMNVREASLTLGKPAAPVRCP